MYKEINNIKKTQIKPIKMRNKSRFLMMVTLLWAGLQSSNAQLVIGNFGNTEFAVDPDYTTASYTQSPTKIVFSPEANFSDILSGIWSTSKNWGSYSLNDFGLIFSISGTNPDLGFTIEFYNSNFDIVNTFEGYTTLAAASPTFVPLSLTSAIPGDMSDVKAMGLTWNGTGGIDMELESVSVVPEPSTLTLLAIAGTCLIAIKIIRKNKKTFSCSKI